MSASHSIKADISQNDLVWIGLYTLDMYTQVVTKIPCCRGTINTLLSIGLTQGILTREELKQSGRGISTWQYSDDITVEFESLDDISFTPSRIRDFIGESKIDGSFITAIDNAEVFGEGGIGVTQNNNIILESADNADQTLTWGGWTQFWKTIAKNFIERKLFTPKYMSGTYCFLLSNWNGYFHWLYDHLPKIEGIEYYQRITGENITIIIPSSPPKWMKESLQLVGYDPKKCLEWNHEWVSVGRLIVPSLRRYRDIPNPDAIFWLRNRILNNLSVERSVSDYSNRIYISRNDANRRQVVNEQDVMDCLRDHGFESYILTELSFGEQVKLFDQAEIIIGPHGANLANIAFSSDSIIIEIGRENVNSACYYSVAQINNMEYYYTGGTSVGDNIRADVSDLERILNELID